ncbi:MAG: hypothetical protein MJD61_08030 [Proteobacteria bacterium]|nr:hypothetical protein [Pseudomonadota bacterium]
MSSERERARALLSYIESIDINAPERERERRLAELARFKTASESQRKARDSCLDAHRALLSAEAHQARARRELAAGPRLRPARISAVEADIRHSDRSLSRARALFRQCRDRARRLALHYDHDRSGG